jgi:hypothetical protein
VTDASRNVTDRHSSLAKPSEPAGPSRTGSKKAEKTTAAAADSPGGWKPPAGGAAEKAGNEMIAAGKLSPDDVAACWKACEVKGISTKSNADAIAAQWVTQQRPSPRGRRTERVELADRQDPSAWEKPPWDC